MEEVKSRISNLLKATERKGIEDLLAWMDENGFYSAPCSSKYHLTKPGGLAEHSLNVFRCTFSMIEAFYLKQEETLTFDFINSIVICSLLHDLGKVGQFGKPAYIENADSEGGAFRTNKDLFYIPHEIRSIAIASRFIELTEEEQFAILYHNGLYGELNGFKGKETPLYMILHWADMWASRVVEKE